VLDSAYISQVFPLGPAEAIEAPEAWYRRLASTTGGRRLVGGHRLRLRPWATSLRSRAKQPVASSKALRDENPSREYVVGLLPPNSSQSEKVAHSSSPICRFSDTSSSKRSLMDRWRASNRCSIQLTPRTVRIGERAPQERSAGNCGLASAPYSGHPSGLLAVALQASCVPAAASLQPAWSREAHIHR
jgi:hypothetical protein